MMLHRDADAAQRRGALLPARERRIPAPLEVRLPRLIRLSVGGIELREALRHRARYRDHVARIGLDVRVAARVQIALAAIDRRRSFKQANRARRFEEAGLAGNDAPIARLLRDKREPCDFKLSARADGDVCRACAGDEAGPRLDLVRILTADSGVVDIDVIAADFGGERAPFRFAREHVEVGVSWRGGDGGEPHSRGKENLFHGEIPQ